MTLILTPSGAQHCSAPDSFLSPTRPAVRAAAYDVRAVTAREAQPLVEAWHYAHGVGQVTAAFALHERGSGAVLAVATFNPPSLGAAKLMAGPDRPHQHVLGLSRLCFHPAAPHGAASFLLSRAIRALPERWQVIATYADAAQGVVGTAYQASNFEYLGMTAARPVWTRAGVQVSRQRGARTLTAAELHAEGCVLAARACMYRYRLIRGVDAPRSRRGYPKAVTPLLIAAKVTSLGEKHEVR
jgi:hypothetical protein